MQIPENYYLGLDVGTESVGWAVTDKNYKVCRFNGNSMWGVRLFDDAKDASARRGFRTSERRLRRRKQRLTLLEMLFAEEIACVDSSFFIRMKESALHFEDKSAGIGQYALFNDENYNDKDYAKEFATIYHLRSKLVHSQEPTDIRLVFLAVHHILKSRGHFLFDGDAGNSGQNLSAAVDRLCSSLLDGYNLELAFKNREKFEAAMISTDIGVTAKKKLLRDALDLSSMNEDSLVNPLVAADALAGATVKLSDLFMDDALKEAEKKSICLKADIEEDYDKLIEVLDFKAELILELKEVFDVARLSQILGSHTYISDAKTELYNKNKIHLAMLKAYVRENEPDKYRFIFSQKKKDLKNYAAYSGYKTQSGDYSCNQEDFCSFLKSTLPELKNAEKYAEIYKEIENKTFLTKLKGTENGVIPNQLHRMELVKILENASGYLPFLNQKDENGISVSEKIISLFDFRIPYYVGPLNMKSKTGWIVRTEDKIYPWNFEKVVDVEASAERFIENLIGRCSYTAEKVIPKDSLLYSEFSVLNEINLIKINGREITVDVKKQLYIDKFVNSKKKVTKKALSDYFISLGLMEKGDEITGIDDTVKSTLKSYHDFKRILDKTHDTEMVESIIRAILIFGEDKKMLRRWIAKNCKGLDKDDISYICRLKYKDWGRLSKRFLTEIYHIDEYGEAKSIIEMLRDKNVNLMQLLSSDYMYAEEAKKVLDENLGNDYDVHKMIEDMYIAPAVKRSVWQTLRIINEIVKIKKCAPEKIFIEVARGSKDEVKKRTESRKQKLIELYKKCGEESSELFSRLSDEDDSKLRSDKLYLYYTQFGKCMYSGEEIDLAALLTDNTHYDIDHIYPRSRIKDNSLDNRVLVKSGLNREKTNIYPVSEDIRNRMRSFWYMLKEKGMISEKKYARLVRETELTDKELHDFVARQLVETQQSTKAIAALLEKFYPGTQIVYSKAGNVSDFRQQFDIVKCRDINDLHHAKDAYLNVVVGNVYHTKFTENFFRNIRYENYSLNKVFDFDTPGAWKKEETIKTVKAQVAKNNILFTRMPFETSGQLFDLQLMPAGKGQLSVKQGREIEKYGGYNKVSGTYFFVVEHTEKKKRIRTIETVYLYAKSIYENDPMRYCTYILGLVDPVIICRKIRFDSLLEIDDKKLYITGRSGNRNLYKHSYQLVLDKQNEKYIKNIQKYIERCSKAGKELTLTSYDEISVEKNLALYNLFIEKFNMSVYNRIFKNVLDCLVSGESKFKKLSVLNQCRLLMEVMKSFKCDRQTSNLEFIGGAKSAGIVLYGNNLSKMKKAFLLNQSVTGLFETKIDLLK